MKFEEFKYELTHNAKGFLFGKFILFNDFSLWDSEKDETIQFKSLEDAAQYKIEGKTIAQLIKELPGFVYIFNGGRGGESGMKSFKFSHAPRNSTRGVPDFPSRFNKAGTSSPEKTLELFREKHALSRNESAVNVDEMGFVHEYIHGNRTSVAIGGRKGMMIYHNHPSGSNFSDSDLLSAALGPGAGIVASGSKGDYIFKKGSHFSAKSFSRAVKSAIIKGKDYDDAADRWLKKNAKKYGYTYSFKPAKS